MKFSSVDGPFWIISVSPWDIFDAFLYLGEEKLGSVFQVWPNKCQTEQENHIPLSASYSLTNPAQEAAGQDTWLGHVPFAVCQDTQGLFSWAIAQSAIVQLALLFGIIAPQVQDLTFVFDEVHIKPHSCWPDLNSLLKSASMVDFLFRISTYPPSLCTCSNVRRVHFSPHRSSVKLGHIDLRNFIYDQLPAWCRTFNLQLLS